MKTYVALLLALLLAGCGVMMGEGVTKTMFQYALFGVTAVSIVVLSSGMAD